MAAAIQQVIKGLKRPQKVPPYLLKKYFPKKWREIYQEDTLVNYDDGKYQSSPSTPAEYHAKLYYEMEKIKEVLELSGASPINRSLELGCGFGRLSPWIANLSQQHHAIEPSEDGVTEARKHYPHLNFIRGVGQNIPYPDEYFDFVITWNVLMHIPPQQLSSTTSEITRVLEKGGTLLIMENTTDSESRASWGRSKEEYEGIFDMEAEICKPRPVEKTYNFAKSGEFEAADNHMMVFKK